MSKETAPLGMNSVAKNFIWMTFLKQIYDIQIKFTIFWYSTHMYNQFL